MDLVAVESGRKLRGTTRGGLRKSSAASRKKRDIVEADLPEILITGCRADQTSADAMIGDGFNGALTYNLAAAILDAGGQLTYRQLHEATIEIEARTLRASAAVRRQSRAARPAVPIAGQVARVSTGGACCPRPLAHVRGTPQ
jgi:hypothetical protein